MPVVITCPSCGLQGHIPDGFSAPGAECPRCQTYVPVSLDKALHVNDTATPRQSDGDASPLDVFFTRVASPPAPVDIAVALAAQPAPAEESVAELPSNPHAELEWVREERQRLEAYMARQFALLQQQREEFARWRSGVEAALIKREQDANRQAKLLAAHGVALDQRDAELAATREQLLGMAESLEQLQRDSETQQARHDEARAAADELHEQIGQAQAEHDTLRSRIAEMAAAHEEEHAVWRDRREQMQQRQAALDETELAMRRRLAELDRVETRSQRELEQREVLLRRREQDLEQGGQQLARDREQCGELQRRLAAQSQELETLRRQLPASGDVRLKQELQRYQEELTRNRQEVQERRQEVLVEMRQKENLRRKLVLVQRRLEQVQARPGQGGTS